MTLASIRAVRGSRPLRKLTQNDDLTEGVKTAELVLSRRVRFANITTNVLTLHGLSGFTKP